MILAVTLRVLRQVLLEPRLVVGAGVVILLFGVSALLSVERQRIDLQVHAEDAAAARDQSDLEGLVVVRPPHPLSFISAGSDRLPRQLRITPQGIEVQTRETRGGPQRSGGSGLDWIYIVTLCLSLLTIVLCYDVPSGERESGTLRLVLAHPIPRSSYLLGSFLGRLLALLVPLVLGVLVSLVLVQISPAFELGPTELLGALFVLGLAILYLTVFGLFSIWVSSLCRRSSTALVWLSLFWVVTVVILPANGGVLAGLVEAPPRHQTERFEIEQIQRNYEAPGSDHYQRIRQVVDGGGQPSTIQRNLERMRDELVAEQRAKLEQRDERIAALQDDYLRRRERQLVLSRWLTLVSPAVLFRDTTERLLTSGPADYRRFLSEARRYRRTAGPAFDRAQERHRDEALPSISWESRYRGYSVTGVAEWSYVGIPPDRDLFPDFQHTRPTLSGLARAAWGGLALGGLALGFLFGALGRFRRYDAR